MSRLDTQSRTSQCSITANSPGSTLPHCSAANSLDTTVGVGGEEEEEKSLKKADTVTFSEMMKRLMTAESHGGRLRTQAPDSMHHSASQLFGSAAAPAAPAAAICFGGANFQMKRHKS